MAELSEIVERPGVPAFGLDAVAWQPGRFLDEMTSARTAASGVSGGSS